MVATPNLEDGERVIDADGPRLRLLVCYTCNSIDALPWFDGPVQYDDTLNYRLSQHRFADGNPHIGMNGLATVNEASWENPNLRRRILADLSKLRKGGEAEGLGQVNYDLRNTFKEDAQACWRAHNRTTDCADYKSDSKRLVPDTRGERKELGLAIKNSARPATSLCVFCPYHSVVMQRARKEQGFY